MTLLPIHPLVITPSPNLNPNPASYYVLQARDPSKGGLRQLGRSNTVKRDLSPRWDALDVRIEQLGHTGPQQLRLEVYDQDRGTGDDLIGVTALELPDLQALLARGTFEVSLPSLSLQGAAAKRDGSTLKGSAAATQSRGSVAGTIMLTTEDLGGGGGGANGAAELKRLREENRTLRVGGGGLQAAGSGGGKEVGRVSFYLLPTAYYSLLTTHYRLLLTTHHSLPLTTHYSPAP